MKGKKQDEVDVASLPPVSVLTASIRFDCQKDRAAKLSELLRTQPRSFQKNITRDDIINAAKEKGFYVDPAAQTNKKDTKAVTEASTELTPAVLSKATSALIADLTLQARKAKKELLEGKPVDPKAAKVDPKKDAGKGGKKDTKQQVVVEAVVEEKQPEKEYTKNFDQLFLLLETNGEEVYLGAQLPLVVVVREKVTNWGGVDMALLDQPGNFEADLKERMDEFIDEEQVEGTEQVQQTQKIQRTLSARSKEFSQQQNEIVNGIRVYRQKSDRSDPIRNLYLKDLVLELDMDIEDEIIKGFPETIIEEICSFSLDQQQFQEWIHPKKTQALITKPPELDPFEQEIARIKEEQRKRAEEERAHAELQLQQEAAAQKKGAKKEPKKTEEDLQKERLAAEEKKKEEEQRQAQIELALQQQQKLKEKMHMQYYRLQLNNVDSQKIGPGTLLEVMLDQIEAEKNQNGQPQISLEDQDDANRVASIFEQLDQVVQGGSLPPSLLATMNTIQETRDQAQSNSTPSKIIIDEADEIERRGYGVKLNDEQSITKREKSIFGNMCFPGIDRYLMPEQPEKSENLRKAEKSKVLGYLQRDPYEFERRQILLKFEEVLKEQEPEQNWFFGDRVYVERHNRNTLTQTIFRALLYDPHVVTRYNEKEDNLLLITYFRNPPGRVLRKKWSAEWRVLPNLENWINFFKTNEANLKNELFYDIDYQQIGNFHERTKVMYPTDNSLILASKYLIGEQEYLRYKIVKEGVAFGILRDVDANQLFWAYFDEGIKITVQEYKVQAQVEAAAEQKVCLNLTLGHGLVLRFMSSGDVIQQYVEQKKNASSRSMLHLYDNAEMNHESETKRIITGQGSVIKYMKDGSIVVLYANGNISVQSRDTWITTNNKGFRKARKIKDGTEWALDPVPCAIKTDPESGSLIYIRDDQTMVIKYKDGSQYTQHRDGTKMMVSASQDSVLVEHEAFCTVRVSLDRVKARTDTIIGHGSTQANVGFENIFERSNDGRVVETWLGDGGRVLSYREKQEQPGYKVYKTNTIQLLYMRDGAVVKVADDGEVVLISAQERMQLNKKGENRAEGEDIDYWLQMFSVPEERRAGVFTAFLQQQIIQTKDDESNFFSISSSGEVVAKISVSLQQNKSEEERPGTPEIPDGDFIEEENKFLPPPTTWIPPRLFLINNNNTGQEFISELQLQNYFRIKGKDALCTQIIDKSVPGIPNCTSLSFITQVLELSQAKKYQINAYIPQTLDIIPKTVKKSEVPLKKVFIFRNVLKFEPFDKETRAQHQQDLERYEVWRKDQLKLQQEFGIIQKSESERDAEFNIQLRILEGRNKDYSSESYDQCKKSYQTRLEQAPLTPKEIEQQFFTAQKKQDGPQQVQNAFVELQKKAQTKNIVRDIKQKAQKNEEDIPIKGFIEHYFQTPEGIKVSKTFPPEVFNVPSKSKPKVLTEQEYSQYARTITNPNHTIKDDIDHVSNQKEDIIIFKPLESQPLNTKSLKPIILKPSVFTQAEIDEEVRNQVINDQALKYRTQKRKDHNVYGSERSNNQMKKVPCLLKTNPKSELNQKYILTDSLTDNRMKISSMATRVYQQAPSINDMRNEGMHQTIIKTLDKKNNLDEMIDKRNLMINAELNDNLRRDLNIIPIAVRMGILKLGGLYQTRVAIKNEDMLAQRVVIKQPQTRFVKVFMKQMGPISLGLVRDVFVQIDAQNEIIGKFQDEFQIVSKHQIYTIPIHAQILDQQQYDLMNAEFRKVNKKPLQKNYVQELRYQHANKDDELVDSQNSDLLPKINYDKNYKIDPYQQNSKSKDLENSMDDDQ